jgi:hypothetical protein
MGPSISAIEVLRLRAENMGVWFQVAVLPYEDHDRDYRQSLPKGATSGAKRKDHVSGVDRGGVKAGPQKEDEAKVSFESAHYFPRKGHLQRVCRLELGKNSRRDLPGRRLAKSMIRQIDS